MRGRFFRPILFVWLALAALAPPPAAGSTGSVYKQAKARYADGDYHAAAVLFKQVADAEPGNAKAWYNLGLSYYKLKRYDDAVAAYQHAQQADPAITFTTEAKFRQKLADAVRKSGRPAGGASGPLPVSDEEVVRLLQKQNIVVMPGVEKRVPPPDQQALEEFAGAGNPPMKVLFMPQEPPGGRMEYANKLHDYMKLGNTALVVVTPQGLWVTSGEFGPADAERLASDSRPAFAESWRAGIEALGVRLRGEVASRQTTSSAAGILFLLVIVAIVAAVIIGRRRARARLEGAVSQRAAALAERLQGAEMDARLSKDERAKEFYAKASQSFVEASALIDRAGSTGDLRRAAMLLAQSEQLLEYSAKPDSAPASMAASGPGAPDDLNAACFFCSQPASAGVLRPETITIEGNTRRVLTCKECGAELHRGHLPQIRVVREGANAVPWFTSRSYDPRRDYWRDDFERRDVVIYHDVFRYDYDGYPAVVYVDDDRLTTRWMDDTAAASLQQQTPFTPAPPDTDFSFSGGGSQAPSDTDFLSSDHS